MAQATITGIGFSTKVGSQGLLDLDATLARFEEQGVDFAELSLFDEDLICGGRILTQQLERLKVICQRRRGLKYTVHGPLGANFMDEPHLDLHLDVCRAMVEICAAIHSDVLVIHAGRAHGRALDDLERLKAVEREALRALGDFAAPLGVRLAVENLFLEDEHHYTHDPVQLAETLAALDHPQICATLDFSHAYITTTFKGQNYLEALGALAPLVNHLHAHDSFGRPKTVATRLTAERMAYGQGDLHLPLGWGNIPWQTLAETLDFRPNTALIVELPARYWSEMDLCIRQARAFQTTVNARAPSR
ncbi:MAG: sugar phosphate isomerase/epimerase family protein [Candidatus Competibacterales bacterium]